MQEEVDSAGTLGLAAHARLTNADLQISVPVSKISYLTGQCQCPAQSVQVRLQVSDPAPRLQAQKNVIQSD